MTGSLPLFAMALDGEMVRSLLHAAVSNVEQWIRDGYERSPVLMAGLALVVAAPLLALAGHIVGRMSVTADAVEQEPIRTELANAMGLGWPRQASIVEVAAGSRSRRHHLARELLSIGREDDNDLKLEHASVHRHHAVLQRTYEAQFIIRDLSGGGGNGVKVNGARVSQAMLNDGDRIEVGAVLLAFEAHPA